MYRNCGRLLFFALLFVLLSGLQIAEAMNVEEETNIGRQVGENLEKEYGVIDDKVMTARIERIGARLAAEASRKEVKYTFKILKLDDVNALSLPGGFIYVNKGLIDFMKTDDELAGVIAHEVGHVDKRHSIRQMEKSMGIGMLLALAVGGRGGGVLGQLAYGAIMAGYSRDDEREADSLGFQYALKAGFNPYGLALGMRKLASLPDQPNYGLFSDHPEPEARLALIDGYASKVPVTPTVQAEGDSAVVVDGGMQLLKIAEPQEGYTPLYRAYLLAGALFVVSRQADFSGDRFIAITGEDKVDLYYDEQYLCTLTEADALAAGRELDDLTVDTVGRLKEWGDARQAAHPQPVGGISVSDAI